MLNEVGHGCDSRNLETTATLQRDGSFILNTPTPEAVKYASNRRQALYPAEC